MFEVGDKVEFDLFNDVFTGIVHKAQSENKDTYWGDVIWVKSERTGFITWVSASTARKVN
jgi:hypothetical protein